MEGRRANRINPLNSLQRRLGAPPAVLPNKWSMLLFNRIKQNYKSQRWLINLNRLLCMKFFFNCLLEKTVTDDAFLPLFFSPPPPSFSFWHELYLLEFLVISFPSEVLAWLDRGLRANQLNERRSNALIMVPDLVQTELGLVQRCLPLCMGEAGSCSPQCTPTLLCSSRSAPPKKRKQLETHARLFHQMGQALSLLIACDLGAEFGHADVLIAAQQRLLQQADCGQMYSCYARQQFGAKARHALVFFLFVSVLLMSAYLYINRWQWFAYSVGLYFKKANTGVCIIYIS